MICTHIQSLFLHIHNEIHSPDSFFKWLYVVEVNAKLAPELSTILENISKVSLRPGCGGKTGTATIPDFKHAMNAMTNSREGGYTRTALDNEKYSKWWYEYKQYNQVCF